MKSDIMSEESYIISAYKNHFSNMSKHKFAIYGIGKNTKIILDNFPSNNIVGLMDELRTGEVIYDKRIISFDEALNLGVDSIIIVARASNVKIIYRRIAELCAEHGIKVYDISGKIVTLDLAVEKSFEKYRSINEQSLKEKINGADIVSFDIFDTLLMRRVLYPRDIFTLIEKQHECGFSKRRINAEMELYREGRHPNIYDIYERMGGGATPELEIKLESEYLVKRESMYAMLQYASLAGKVVYLTSDMYLPGDIIMEILIKFDIHITRENILVSCDYGVAKPTGLFTVLRQKAGSGKILHIGDNFEADIISAERYSIDDTFKIESAVTMLEDSYAAEILKWDNSFANRLLIGDFISRQLNNPFLFSTTQGRFAVNSNYEMGYSFIAPLVYSYFGWMTEKALELRLDCILLSARDGFIIKKIYDLFLLQGITLPSMKYFYTSRAVSVLASIIDDEDILHGMRLAYSGRIEDMLEKRFNLDSCEIHEYDGIDYENYVLLHRDAIMRHAEVARKRYQAYIDSCNITHEANVGFVDFVSSGTCQKALSNFVDFNLHGLYFAVVNSEADYKSDVEINSMFGIFNVFEKGYNILEDYLFLENIMTSDEPTLSGFDDNGNLIFMPEHRTEKQLRTLHEIHTAILDFIKNSKVAVHEISGVDAAVPDLMVHFLKPQYSQINTDYFDEEELRDEFCNRRFNISGR